MTTRTDTCPTCTSLVRVTSADDDLGGDIVTSFCQPMQDAELRRDVRILTADWKVSMAEQAELRETIKSLRIENAALRKSCENWRSRYHAARAGFHDRHNCIEDLP